jgi:1,4-dihydroxy-6-naphthoate synthase
MPSPVTLTLAHSPDPDDVFMWWPLTGKIRPDGTPVAGDAGRPALDTGRFEFRALPADIHLLNRRAITQGDLDITALSVRAYAQVQDRYRLTRCGASFGDGFGPKLVRRTADADRIGIPSLGDPGARIAIPGRETTAFLLLMLAIGPEHAASDRFIEMPFERIIPAVASRDVGAWGW